MRDLCWYCVSDGGNYVTGPPFLFSSRAVRLTVQELDTMQDEEGWEHVVTTLAKAQKAIDLGVACQPQPEEETELTVLCLRNTALDLHQVRSQCVCMARSGVLGKCSRSGCRG